MKPKSILCLGAVYLIGCAVSAVGAPIVVVTSGEQRIQTFDSANPGLLTNDQLITGLAAGEAINAIDLRVSDSTIYGLTNNSRLYTLDPATGQATFVATTGVAATGATGFDFNPVADSGGLPSLRVSGGLITGTTAQNLRVDPATGSTSPDSPFAFAAGDPNASVTPLVPALAYTNNFLGTGSTTLYGIVARSGASINPPILVNIPNPAAGTMSTVGSLGVLNLNFLQGFDISSGGDAFAVLNSDLYTIDLATGQATLVGDIAGNAPIVGLAAGLADGPGPGPAPIPEPATSMLLGTAVAGLYVMRRKRA